MAGQILKNIKNNYIKDLLNRKDFKNTYNILDSKLYAPIFHPIKCHEEEIPNVDSHINLPVENIINDISILNKELAYSAFDLKNLIDVTEEKLHYIDNNLQKEHEHLQDINMLCKKYNDFNNVVELDYNDFDGDYSHYNNVFSSQITGFNNLNYNINEIEGNGYEGNRNVYYNNKFIKDIYNTSDRENIKDDSLYTSYEYSRITALPSEKFINKDINFDENEATCTISLSALEEFNTVRLISSNENLILSRIEISVDGIVFNEVFSSTIDINDINNKIDITNYIPKSGIICFPNTKYVKITLNSNGVTNDIIAIETYMSEKENKNIIYSEKIFKNIPLDYIFSINLFNGSTNTKLLKDINDYISIRESDTNIVMKTSILYDNNKIYIKLNNTFKHNTKYIISINEIKDINNNTLNNNCNIIFTTIPDINELIYLPEIKFIPIDESFSVSVPFFINNNCINNNYISIIDNNYNVIPCEYFLNEAKKITIKPNFKFNHNNNYTLILNNDIYDIENNKIKYCYMINLKTKENNIRKLDDIYYINNNMIMQELPCNIILDDNIYVINSSGEKIKSTFKKNKFNANIIEITFEEELEYNTIYKCIVDSKCKTYDNINLTEQLVFSIITNNLNTITLHQAGFTSVNNFTSINIDTIIEPSYLNNQYIYIIDSNTNKKIDCKIEQDIKTKDIYLKYSFINPLSDYYIFINKNTLSLNLKPINKTYVKKIRTNGINNAFLGEKYCVPINSIVSLLNNENKYNKAYCIDQNLNIMNTSINFNTSIEFATNNLLKDNKYKVVLEYNNNTDYFDINTEYNNIEYRINKLFINPNESILINIFNDIKDIFIIDDKYNKINCSYSIINTNTKIKPNHPLNYDSKYKIVIESNNIVYYIDFITMETNTSLFKTIDIKSNILTIKTSRLINDSTISNIKVLNKFNEIIHTDITLSNIQDDIIININDDDFAVNDNFTVIIPKEVKNAYNDPLFFNTTYVKVNKK